MRTRTYHHAPPETSPPVPAATPLPRPGRLAAAETAAEEVVEVTGWDRDEILTQMLEDTCHTHGVWCCRVCFSAHVPHLTVKVGRGVFTPT